MEDVFSVTPTSDSFELIPGTEYHGSIIVAKPAQSTNSFTYTVKAIALNATEDKLDLVTTGERTQIADWITFENPEGTINANEKSVVNYTIKVPQDAIAGGQYGAIVVSSKPDDSASSDISVKNIYEIGCMLYARVSGELVHSGQITKNEFPSFITGLPLATTTGFKNDGNIHETAVTTITIRDVISNQIVYPAEENGSAIEDIIMPATSRDTMHQIGDFGQLGIYEVTQNVEYLGESSSESHTLILCPVWLIASVVLFIACLVLTIVVLAIKHRKKNAVL